MNFPSCEMSWAASDLVTWMQQLGQHEGQQQHPFFPGMHMPQQNVSAILTCWPRPPQM